MNVITLKCPGCGAALRRDPSEARGFFICEYCGTKVEVDQEVQTILPDSVFAKQKTSRDRRTASLFEWLFLLVGALLLLFGFLIEKTPWNYCLVTTGAGIIGFCVTQLIMNMLRKRHERSIE